VKAVMIHQRLKILLIEKLLETKVLKYPLVFTPHSMN
jgi:hypothetical protein